MCKPVGDKQWLYPSFIYNLFCCTKFQIISFGTKLSVMIFAYEVWQFGTPFPESFLPYVFTPFYSLTVSLWMVHLAITLALFNLKPREMHSIMRRNELGCSLSVIACSLALTLYSLSNAPNGCPGPVKNGLAAFVSL